MVCWIEGGAGFFLFSVLPGGVRPGHASPHDERHAQNKRRRIEAAAEFGAHIGGVHRRVGEVLNRRRSFLGTRPAFGWSKVNMSGVVPQTP